MRSGALLGGNEAQLPDFGSSIKSENWPLCSQCLIGSNVRQGALWACLLARTVHIIMLWFRSLLGHWSGYPHVPIKIQLSQLANNYQVSKCLHWHLPLLYPQKEKDWPASKQPCSDRELPISPCLHSNLECIGPQLETNTPLTSAPSFGVLWDVCFSQCVPYLNSCGSLLTQDILWLCDAPY